MAGQREYFRKTLRSFLNVLSPTALIKIANEIESYYIYQEVLTFLPEESEVVFKLIGIENKKYYQNSKFELRGIYSDFKEIEKRIKVKPYNFFYCKSDNNQPYYFNGFEWKMLHHYHFKNKI